MALLKPVASTLLAMLLCALPGLAQTQTPEPAPAAVPSIPRSATPTHASVHRTIATASPEAQADFDRALAFLYAFNMGAAREGFRAAEQADHYAALAYFGEALCETFDINRPTTPGGEKRGAAAVRRGRAIAADAPEDERTLLAAAAQRYNPHLKPAQRFRAFFAALQAYTAHHPQDGMALTIAADAGWTATDTLLDKHGVQTADARTIARDLDAALALDPGDIGAHHLRIHFWEAVGKPEHARFDADYLASLAYDPGESHLLHMAGHIYTRIGNYAGVVTSNEAACANDVAYFAAGTGPGQTYMRTYHDHDVDFVLYGLTTLGRDAEARAFAAHEDVEMRRNLAIRLHDRGALRALGFDPDDSTVNKPLAEARAGLLGRAQYDARDFLKGPRKATGLLRGVLALAKGNLRAAVVGYHDAYAAARRTELGDPKYFWQIPIGEGYGAALLRTHAFVAAETVFRAELRRYPNDPHLWFGLAEALKGQRKDDTAARASYTEEWKGVEPLTLADLG